MKWLIDANILLDVLQAREPFLIKSSLVWKLCETGQVEGYISTLTFANLVYVMRRELDPASIREVLDKLLLIFYFVDLTEADLKRAAEMEWNDYEDAMQCAMAERIKADYIVTRNIRDFLESPTVTALTPEKVLGKVAGSERTDQTN